MSSAADKRAAWNQRYGAKDLVWGAEPNRFVAEAFAGRPARGRALDLACGEGRNAIWLAEQGWQATGADFSSVALERGRKLAAQRGVEVDFLERDAVSWQPEPDAFALVVIAYLQIPDAEFATALDNAARALAPGGELFMIGHARRNVADGTGGPQDPDVLWDADSIAARLGAHGLEVDEAGEVLRPVEGAERPAIDVRVRARRRDA